MRVLVVDIGGTHVKVLATSATHHEPCDEHVQIDCVTAPKT